MDPFTAILPPIEVPQQNEDGTYILSEKQMKFWYITVNILAGFIIDQFTVCGKEPKDSKTTPMLDAGVQ